MTSGPSVPDPARRHAEVTPPRGSLHWERPRRKDLGEERSGENISVFGGCVPPEGAGGVSFPSPEPVCLSLALSSSTIPYLYTSCQIFLLFHLLFIFFVKPQTPSQESIVSVSVSVTRHPPSTRGPDRPIRVVEARDGDSLGGDGEIASGPVVSPTRRKWRW